MNCQKSRILIIDDDSHFKRVIHSALNDICHLEYLENAEEVWDALLFCEEPFELIIMETVLDDKDSIGLLKEIRDIHPWLPVLVVTGHSTHNRAKEICNLNVAGYFEKHLCSTEHIKGQVQNQLNKYNAFSLHCTPSKIIQNKIHRLHPIIMRCIDEIHKKFHMPITAEILAVKCSISKSHLSKLFKKECSMTIKEYVTLLRIENAKKLLKETSYSVSDIQEFVGYKSRVHFFNTFKKKTGISPLKFRSISVKDS